HRVAATLPFTGIRTHHGFPEILGNLILRHRKGMGQHHFSCRLFREGPPQRSHQEAVGKHPGPRSHHDEFLVERLEEFQCGTGNLISTQSGRSQPQHHSESDQKTSNQFRMSHGNHQKSGGGGVVQPDRASQWAGELVRSNDRQFESLAVLPSQQGAGRRIVRDGLVGSVVVQHRSGPPGDVGQMTEHRALVIDLDVGVRDRPGSQTVKEIAPVVGIRFSRL
ncbi:MAG: hypothetical protein ACK56I_28080, partial [bacterium]